MKMEMQRTEEKVGIKPVKASVKPHFEPESLMSKNKTITKIKFDSDQVYEGDCEATTQLQVDLIKKTITRYDLVSKGHKIVFFCCFFKSC